MNNFFRICILLFLLQFNNLLFAQDYIFEKKTSDLFDLGEHKNETSINLIVSDGQLFAGVAFINMEPFLLIKNGSQKTKQVSIPKGKGPFEIMYPGTIAIWENQILIHGLSLSKIIVYDVISESFSQEFLFDKSPESSFMVDFITMTIGKKELALFGRIEGKVAFGTLENENIVITKTLSFPEDFANLTLRNPFLIAGNIFSDGKDIFASSSHFPLLFQMNEKSVKRIPLTDDKNDYELDTSGGPMAPKSNFSQLDFVKHGNQLFTVYRSTEKDKSIKNHIWRVDLKDYSKTKFDVPFSIRQFISTDSELYAISSDYDLFEIKEKL